MQDTGRLNILFGFLQFISHHEMHKTFKLQVNHKIKVGLPRNPESEVKRDGRLRVTATQEIDPIRVQALIDSLYQYLEPQFCCSCHPRSHWILRSKAILWEVMKPTNQWITHQLDQRLRQGTRHSPKSNLGLWCNSIPWWSFHMCWIVFGLESQIDFWRGEFGKANAESKCALGCQIVSGMNSPEMIKKKKCGNSHTALESNWGFHCES